MSVTVQLDTGAERLRKKHLTQQQIALPLIILIATILVVAPLLVLLRTSLLPAGSLPFDTIGVTLDNFAGAFGDPATLRLLYNTVLYATGSVLLGIAIATPLAWL